MSVVTLLDVERGWINLCESQQKLMTLVLKGHREKAPLVLNIVCYNATKKNLVNVI